MHWDHELERGHSCPQQPAKSRGRTASPRSCATRELLRTRMSALQFMEIDNGSGLTVRLFQASHQFREPAILADRIGMGTKIAHNLEQPLLGGSRCEGPQQSSAQQSLARQTQQGVIFSAWP